MKGLDEQTSEGGSRPSAPPPSSELSPERLPTRARTISGQRHFLPPELMSIVVPSLQVGAGIGTVGLFAGAAAGIVRSAPPILFSIATAGQWFVLGSSYYASRLVALKALGGEKELPPADKVKASAMAGGFAGMIGGLIRGPRNIIPGTIVFTLFGAGGQAIANSFASKGVPLESKKSILHSKWSPVTPLTDREYEKMLEEKLLRVEAEIALVDDHMKELREAESHAEEQISNSESTSKPAPRT
ncbi:hypothetical protein QBC46DRAFT_390455 [Diplogelasinospora grovesii]|uniref:Uncharacterized protein n=1 Tax=Diplogelasinospora grovesii TaxID=303347 RepID=A0AAN6N3G5_9PEZI|nr:hypothetical protein QBC46DRAFT_390455 [Diplogelasinospora grovesii]